MAKSQQTYNKSEKEKKRLKKREDKKKKMILKGLDDAMTAILMAKGIPYQTPKKLVGSTIKRVVELTEGDELNL